MEEIRDDGLAEALNTKLRQGRPVALSAEEAAFIRETVRRAMAVTLERPAEEITDHVLVFDELELDSVDVFDLLDQVADVLDVEVELEQLPEETVYGGERITFRDFADRIIAFLESSPPPPRKG